MSEPRSRSSSFSRIRDIEENPISSAGEPYFPRRILGHALAEAAIRWAEAWVDAFYAGLGVTPLACHGAALHAGCAP